MKTTTINQAVCESRNSDKELLKTQHGAGGFVLSVTSGKGNTRFSSARKKIIIQAIEDSWTDACYMRTDGKIVRTLLNGTWETI